MNNLQKIFSGFALLILIFGGCAFWASEENEVAKNPDPNHTHADFAVWINGEKLDFTAEKYMSHVPTEPEESNGDTSANWQLFPQATAHNGIDHGTTAEGIDHESSDLKTYLHLHDGNGDVIHRHKPGLTLGDFFSTIGFELTVDCLTLDTAEKVCNEGVKKWQMFVNNQEVPVNPAYDFQDLDQILLTYGSAQTEISEQLTELTANACLYSRTCPERGEPPVENCIADPTVPCVVVE